ncbi:MAG: transcription elongation factor GreA [Bacteroidales bacterium]|nr:transcription elongation factor GreA [Bacteroidales bacterium]
MAINYVTEEGLKKLKEELAHLESVERPKVIQQIAEARDKGDLSENAEYDAAKEAQGHLEAKIAKLKILLANSRTLDASKVDTSQVQILNKVTIKNVKNNAKMTYTLVPETEADLKSGKISVTTPIAKGLLGKKVGDQVEIKIPAGTATFEIIEISI